MKMTEDNRKENTEEERDTYITANQKHRLILFVEQHYKALFERSSISDDLIKGKFWKALTVQLNCIGPEKNESGWRRCFICYKVATRLKLKEIESKRVSAEKLNETDLRIMKMCGMDTYGIDLNNSYELVVPSASTKNSGLLAQEIENEIEELNIGIGRQSKKKSNDSFQQSHEQGRQEETYEEAKLLEKRYSKHRDSNSFRQAEAQKQNKREHPVNSIECESNNLIDVTHVYNKIDQTLRTAKDANENKEKESESLPKNRQPSKIPKIITKNSGRITKCSKDQKYRTGNLKTKVDTKKVLPLQVKPSILLPTKTQTKQTSETETFGEKKKDKTVLPNTSKYHRNCTATHTNTSGTVNLNKTIGIKNVQPLQFKKSIPLQMKNQTNETTKTDAIENASGNGGKENYSLPKQSKRSESTAATSKKTSGTANLKEFEFDFIPIKKTVPPKFIKSNPLHMENKTKETSNTACNGKTVGNVEKKLSATNIESLSFDENRDYVMSFLKKYHTMYMTDEDNIKDSSEETMKGENQNSNQNQSASDLAREASLIRVSKRSKNEVDVHVSGKNENETKKRKKNNSLPKQSKRSTNMKALSTRYRKSAKVCDEQWRVDSVEKKTRENHSPLEKSERNEYVRKNDKRNGIATGKNDLLRDKCVNDSRPKSIKTNHSREYFAQHMIKPASTTTDVDFQSKVLSAVNEIKNFCVNSERKRIAFEAKIQSSFDTFTRETLNGFNPAPVRAPVHTQIRAPAHAPIRAPAHAPIRAPFRKPIQAPIDHKSDRLAVLTSFRAPVQFDEDEMEEFDQNFEIKSKDNLEELEWALRADLDVKHKLLYRLNEFGGEDEKAAIRLKMKYLVHDTVLDLYTWRGTTTNPPKDAFKKLVNINNLIFRSVREQFPSYKRNDYNKYIVEWLKHSTTRQRTVTYHYPQHYHRNNEDYDDDEYDSGQNDGDQRIDNVIFDEDE